MSVERHGEQRRDHPLHEADHDLLYTDVKSGAREHARKLCGLLPHTIEEVKGCESAAVIFRLLALIAEMETSKGRRARKALEKENAALSLELSQCHREMRRCRLEYPLRRAVG